MCRPTKRPKPFSAAPVVLAASTTQATSEIEDFGKDLETFVFDIKANADLMSLEDFWPQEAIAMVEQPVSESIVNAETNSITASTESIENDARPKTFVYTAFDMVSDARNASAIGFSDDGTIIEIRNLELLAEKILPAYFRHKNVTSFYRQLNSYGFRTTRSSSRDVMHAFSHELFRKDRADLLSNIFRKKCLKKQARLTSKEEDEMKALCNGEMPPSSPVSVSSSSDESHSDEIDLKKKIARCAPVPIDTLFEAEAKAAEQARALDARNKQLAAENRSLLQESEQAFASVSQLMDAQASLIDRLFGREASRAFLEEAKQCEISVMGKSPIGTIPLDSQGLASQGDSSEVPFDDADLALLDNIFASDAIFT